MSGANDAMPASLNLVSHCLCPYVQRAAIVLAEKGVAFERTIIDLSAKPDWFNAISPLGKVPLLRVGANVIFESAVILEYIEETHAPSLHPADALQRADHRSWIEFGSTVLSDISALYNAPDAVAFEARRSHLVGRFAWIEKRMSADPWFDGPRFSLVDAAFAPVFRYFDTFDSINFVSVFEGLPKTRRWREALQTRPSVRNAVVADYGEGLRMFLAKRNSHLSRLMERVRPTAPAETN